jgi:heptosyltransferase-2
LFTKGKCERFRFRQFHTSPTAPAAFRMLDVLLQVPGWLLAHTPEALLRGFASLLGRVVYACVRGRRRVMLRNLAAVFPERGARWQCAIARESCVRLVETVLLALATPHFSKERVRAIARLDGTAEAYFRECADRPRPIVLGSAHLAYWEALSWLPVLADFPMPELSTIYRPLRNPGLNDWVVRTRGRFGVALLSRKSGIHNALHILRRNGLVNVLFDQNAGGHGTLTSFFGRRISMTELPALLVGKTNADLRLIGTRRTGFWRVEIFIRDCPHDGTLAGMMAALNIAFEDVLRTDQEVCASWLWAHDRWKINELPVQLAKITEKRNLLEEDARFRASRAKL